MAQLVFIIGNGFDIDMGLPSRYSDFAKSQEFKDLANRMCQMSYEEEDATFPEKLFAELFY